MIVDRAERLIGQVSGAEVVHQRWIQRRRVERRGNTAKQDDARRRRILRDSDVGRERTDDADRRVLGDPRSARDAVVETIVEEQRITRILRGASSARQPARACPCSGCDRFHRSFRFPRTSLSETTVRPRALARRRRAFLASDWSPVDSLRATDNGGPIATTISMAVRITVRAVAPDETGSRDCVFILPSPSSWALDRMCFTRPVSARTMRRKAATASMTGEVKSNRRTR